MIKNKVSQVPQSNGCPGIKAHINLPFLYQRVCDKNELWKPPNNQDSII